MVRSLAAFVIFALLGTAVVALPGFAPRVEAREAAVLANGDRLKPQAAALDCAKETWPHLPAFCLQGSSGGKIQEVRLVSARR